MLFRSYSKVILSSITGNDLSSGFLIGVNQANRLFLEIVNSGVNKIYTSKIKIDKNKIYHFYDSNDFEQYAITTKDPWTKDPSNALTHRWVMRDLIADYSGDKEYAYKKKKGISAFSIPDPNFWFLMEDYNILTSKTN